MNSLFLTFEGPDGCGKSTQARLLWKSRSQGYDVFLTREPGGTSLGEAVRELLLGKEYELTSSAEALLYAAARAQHVEEKIRPALAKGQIVISRSVCGLKPGLSGLWFGPVPPETAGDQPFRN